MTCDIALIGFGEAGSTFAKAGDWSARARGWDRLAGRRAAMAAAGLPTADGPAQALSGAPLVLSLVTADEALKAAQDYAPLLSPGALWCDGNSVAPETKRAAARAVEAAGGRYVDLAVLAPVHPARLAVPLLLAGAAADDAAERLNVLGFTNLRVVGDEVGRASAIKMIRSVMVKGIEALTDEMMAAAEAAGVADEVLSSLDASEKALPWAQRAAYNLERMHTHGLRRAAEMEESAKTLLALGVPPVMTRGTVYRQRQAAQQNQASLDANGGGGH
ncbi:NAD(P)-dependent oxidoreductase [Novosphingobium sp.]|uniref:NAD(P)-dependent oxidoreductase n=1 Tax=Novosphingobium sp. TaxID=1874826 RepID=UPI001EB69758|nr:NAD(P)-dependent oxidoreductase [Novosphingobium sp.]MBK9010796.1 NAD(P)-dependent oxidoreductase [Novosphingobium sp.]